LICADQNFVLSAVPALADAGPNARLRRGDPLSSSLWRHRF